VKVGLAALGRGSGGWRNGGGATLGEPVAVSDYARRMLARAAVQGHWWQGAATRRKEKPWQRAATRHQPTQ